MALLRLLADRGRFATDLPDDVGANLSQIAILSEVARAQAQPTDLSVDRPLARIATLSRDSADAMSEIVWAIDPCDCHFPPKYPGLARTAADRVLTRTFSECHPSRVTPRGE